MCSVTVKNLPPETSKNRALEVARLALTVISLAWELPSTALDGLSLLYDRRRFRREIVSFGARTKINYQIKWSQKYIDGVRLQSHDDWEKISKEYEFIFPFCGQVFEYAVNPTQKANRSKVLDALWHSLIWFHAACREENNLIAIVKYAACLDSLVPRGNTKNIVRMVCKQLGIPPETSLFRNDNKSVTNSVKEIYEYGRSRTIHGTNDKLGYDWTKTRTQAEVLSRICLLLCISSATKDDTIIDTKGFI